MKPMRLGLAVAVLVLVAAGSAIAPPAWTQAASPANAIVDRNDCKTCHEPAVVKLETTSHATLAQSCAACHAGSAEHLQSNLEKGEPGPIFKFGKATPAADTNKICLGCHEKGNQADWDGGHHDRRGVACTSCHSIHDFKSEKAQLKTARDAETCFTCHQQIRAKSMRVSHHPVREGVMGCTSCHNPHDGSRPKMIQADWTNELCLKCHAEKRGPFLWEHAPVRENCMNCHDPHGSNHEKLLLAKQPYLCQRCHLNTRHPGTLYDQRNTVAGTSVSNRAVEHACRNCHQNIHGGNAPSGPYLGR